MKSRLLATVAFALSLPTPGWAQTEEPPADEGGISEIIVTAQRREESLQKAAVAVTAVTGDALIAAGVTDTAQLSKVAPSLQVQPTGGAGFSLYLRGVGTLSGNSFAENAIAFNFNEVYVGRPTSLSGTFYDLERVEVVKGPQDTLYGRNATGGAINVIPNRPVLGERSADINLGYGNYDAVTASAAVNLPLGDKIALRAAGQIVHRDGYLSDGTSDDIGQAARLSLLAEPSDTVRVVLVADYFNSDGKGPGSVIVPPANGSFVAPSLDDRIGGSDPRSVSVAAAVAAKLQAPVFCGGLGGFVRSGCVLTPRNDSFVEGEYWGISGKLTADLGFAELTVLPAYRKSETDFVNYLPGFLLDVTEEARQHSLEVRLASNDGDRLQYVLGGFYFKEKQNAVNFFAQGRLATTLFTPRLTTESVAAFGQASYEIVDGFRIVGGLRWTNEDKQQITGLGNGNPFTPNPFNPPIQANFTGDLGFDRVTWKAGIEFDAGPRSLLYANVATGFKSGGFFVSAPPTNTFAPEKLTAYTIGAKNRFFDNRLQFNVEGFYWDYKDQQITFVGASLTAAGTFASSGVTVNAGQAKMYGVEVDSIFQASPNDVFSLNAQYLHTNYDSFLVPLFSSTPAPPDTACRFAAVRPVPGGTFYDTDCSGKPTLNSPKWSMNAGYEHTFELSDGLELVAGVRSRIEASRFLDITFVPEARQKSYTMTDALVTLKSADGGWSISGYVNNIEDEQIKAQVGTRPILGLKYSSLRAPRTYGIRGAFRF